MKFVSTTEGCVVLKPSSTIAADVFANRLAQMLGIQTGKFRLLIRGSDSTGSEYSESNFAVTMHHLKQAGCGSTSMIQTMGGEEKIREGKGLGYPPTQLLLEFLPGPTLDEVGEETFSGSDGLDALGDLGKILVLDILTNNWDRLPLPGLWEHEGNGGNFILTSSGLVAIDNSTTSIINEDKVKAYVTAARALVEDARSASIHTSEQKESADTGVTSVGLVGEHVRSHLDNGFGGPNIKEQGARAVQRGFWQGIEVATTVLTDAAIDALYKEILDVFTPVLERLSLPDEAVGLGRINPAFVRHLLQEAFRPFASASAEPPKPTSK